MPQEIRKIYHIELDISPYRHKLSIQNKLNDKPRNSEYKHPSNGETIQKEHTELEMPLY